MSNFESYVEAHERVCRYCKFKEMFPERSYDIWKVFNEGRLRGKKPTQYAKLVADYISDQVGFPMKGQCVRDHFRSGHEEGE